MRPTCLLRSAIILKPSTILSFHRALVSRKHHLLFNPKNRRKAGPIGPSPALIAIIVEMKRRNSRFGYQCIADQISLVFDLEVDKEVVRRVLVRHFRPGPGSNGPSWLTFLGMKWSTRSGHQVLDTESRFGRGADLDKREKRLTR
jgi:putative transposase